MRRLQSWDARPIYVVGAPMAAASFLEQFQRNIPLAISAQSIQWSHVALALPPMRSNTDQSMLSPYSDDKAPPSSRQKPGSACDECRRRKLRCDRERPQCGVCFESGVVCNTSTLRPPRGPKRGHFKALQTRIGECCNIAARHVDGRADTSALQMCLSIVS